MTWHVEEEYSHATGPVPAHLLHTVARSVAGPRRRRRLVTPQNVQVGSMIGKQMQGCSCCRQRNAYWSLISFVKLRITKNTLKYHRDNFLKKKSKYLVICSCEVSLTNDKENCFYVAVDKKWTEWLEWTNCGVTCGGGVQSRNKTCTNPPPAHRGKKCYGTSYATNKCNTAECQGWFNDRKTSARGRLL